MPRFTALTLMPGASRAVTHPRFDCIEADGDRISRPHFPALPAKPPVDVFDHSEAGGLDVAAKARGIRGEIEWAESSRDRSARFTGAV